MSSCPRCDGEVDDISSVPDSEACVDCGYVLGTSNPAPSPSDTGLGSIENPEDSGSSWMEHSKVSGSTEKNVALALDMIESAADVLPFSDAVRRRSAEYYADTMTERYTEGRSMRKTVAACIRISTREEREVYPDTDLSDAIDVDENDLVNTAREVRRHLEIPQTIPRPIDHIYHLVRELEVSDTVEKEAQELLNAVPESSISGRSPVSYAAATIYLASDGEITQRAAAIAAGITTETVRVRLRELENSIPSATSTGQDTNSRSDTDLDVCHTRGG